MTLEITANGAAQALLDQLVGVGQFQIQSTRERAGDGGLPATRHPHQGNHPCTRLIHPRNWQVQTPLRTCEKHKAAPPRKKRCGLTSLGIQGQPLTSMDICRMTVMSPCLAVTTNV